MRQTSIDVYNKIKETGLLGGRRFEVYEALHQNGPMTQVETVRFLQAKKRNITDHGFTPRFSELRRMGAIQEVRERKCTVTGMTVIEWAVTENMPVKLEKRVPKDQVIKHLEEENKALKREIETLRAKETKQAFLDFKMERDCWTWGVSARAEAALKTLGARNRQHVYNLIRSGRLKEAADKDLKGFGKKTYSEIIQKFWFIQNEKNPIQKKGNLEASQENTVQTQGRKDLEANKPHFKETP